MGTMEKIMRTKNSNAFVLSQALERDKIITKGNMTAPHCTEVRFASFLSGGFITATVVEMKLAKQISRKGSVKDCSWQRYINRFRIKRQIFL